MAEVLGASIRDTIRLMEKHNADPDHARDLIAFYDRVDATLDSYTQTLRMRPLETASSATFTSWLRPYADPDEHWSYATYRTTDGDLKAIASPTTDIGPETAELFPFVETHQTMVVWWLTASWRARQFIQSVEWSTANGFVVPAAACARGLAETASQFHADAVKIAAAWDALKRATSRAPSAGFSERTTLMQILNEATAGGKFDDKVPALKGSFGRIQRSNVLTAVDKLTKSFGPTWQEDYQWLCNVVHPSVGNYFAFATPALGHESGTHLVMGFSGQPLELTSGGEVFRQEVISTAISRAVARSARALLTTADDALHLLDDVALSTRAAEISTFRYWRATRVRDTQAPCPCRSGRRAYRCEHRLGQAGPEVRAIPMEDQVAREQGER